MRSPSPLDPRTWLPLLAALLLLIIGLSAIDAYNVTWDEALGDFFFGERYASFFTTFDARYLDFEGNPYPDDRSPDLGLSPFRGRPWEYYPVANTLAAVTSQVLSRWLGLVDAFDGFHAVNLWLGALLMWFLFRFLAPRLGLVTATIAVGLLFTAPRVVCHLMANIKDFPLLVLYTLTVLTFFSSYERGSSRGLLASGLLWGLTLGTKANALFLPGIPLLVVLLGERPVAWQGRTRKLLLTLAAAGLLGTVVMVAVWPYLWSDPIGRFAEHLRYIGFRKEAMRAESFAPVLQAILHTTPPTFLALFAVGCGPCLGKALKRDRLAILWLAWVVVVLGRYLLPQAVNFDGVRHFLELFPAMAAIAGWGAAWLLVRLGRMFRAASVPKIKAVAATLLLLPSGWAVLSTHPFQIAYWNGLVGGYAGARARDLPQASDYWGMSYRLGMRWLNENAPRDAYLAVPVVEHAVRLVAPLRLREDIQLLPVTTPFSPRISPERLELTRAAAAERPLYVMFVDRRDWRNELMVDCLRFLTPEAEWQLEGEPVLAIYRYPRPGADPRWSHPTP